jgi:hypothetical protein
MKWIDDLAHGWQAGFAVLVVAVFLLLLWWAIASWLSILGLVW